MTYASSGKDEKIVVHPDGIIECNYFYDIETDQKTKDETKTKVTYLGRASFIRDEDATMDDYRTIATALDFLEVEE